MALSNMMPAALDGELAFGLINAGQFFKKRAFHTKANGAGEVVARGDRIGALDHVEDFNAGFQPTGGPCGDIANVSGVGRRVDTSENAIHGHCPQCPDADASASALSCSAKR